MKALITLLATPSGAAARFDQLPCCGQRMRLDHVGVAREDGDYVDLTAVTAAQRMHARTCRRSCSR